MLYQVFDPPPNLAPYVRFFWALEADVEPGEEFVHRSMADGCVEMVFHYRSAFDEITHDEVIEASPFASIQAQSTRHRRFVTRESFGIFGAYLFPFAIPRLFGFPASDFTNISPDLASVFGKEGSLLDEQMCTAPTNENRIAIVSEFLSSKLTATNRELPTIYRSVHSVLANKGTLAVESLAAEHNLSKRQFERRFKDLAGLSPKLYSRVVRFQAATQFKLTATRDLTEIAYACGYYDQSHFINDFREFSGYTPKEYFWNAAEGTQYLDTEQMSHFSNS
ncbi:MAG: helix-turn-helix transcriptional regulator [Pyrinomonadaceae bacterium]